MFFSVSGYRAAAGVHARLRISPGGRCVMAQFRHRPGVLASHGKGIIPTINAYSKFAFLFMFRSCDSDYSVMHYL